MNRVSQRAGCGFTLVEIMIVVAILGLLAVLALPAFARARQTSITQKCIQNQRALFQAVMRYEFDHNTTLFGLIRIALEFYIRQGNSSVLQHTQIIEGKYELQDFQGHIHLDGDKVELPGSTLDFKVLKGAISFIV